MKITKFPFLVLIALVFAVEDGLAQSRPESVEMRLSFMTLGGDRFEAHLVPTDALDQPGGAPVLLTPRIRTRELSYRGIPTVVLRRPTGEGAQSVVAQIVLPRDVSRALVFLVPDRQTGRFRAHVMPESVAKTRPDELVIFNATGATLRAQLAGMNLTLAQGTHPPIATQSWRGGTNRFVAAVETSDGWIKVADGELQFPVGQRSYLLLMPPRRPRPPVIQMFSVFEHIEQEEPISAAR